MNPKEQARLQVLNSLLAEHATLDQAAKLLGITTRHTRRILAAYREKGVAAVAHGHRCSSSSLTRRRIAASSRCRQDNFSFRSRPHSGSVS